MFVLSGMGFPASQIDCLSIFLLLPNQYAHLTFDTHQGEVNV
jgi:hypothetical protein